MHNKTVDALKQKLKSWPDKQIRLLEWIGSITRPHWCRLPMQRNLYKVTVHLQCEIALKDALKSYQKCRQKKNRQVFLLEDAYRQNQKRTICKLWIQFICFYQFVLFISQNGYLFLRCVTNHYRRELYLFARVFVCVHSFIFWGVIFPFYFIYLC